MIYAAIIMIFGAFSLLGLGILLDFRGLRSKFQDKYEPGSLDWQRARTSSLIPGWFFLIAGCAVIIGVLLRLLGVYDH